MLTFWDKIKQDVPLTDKELEEALDLFQRLEVDLQQLRPEFNLALKEVAYNLNKLSYIKLWRNKGKSDQPAKSKKKKKTRTKR